MNGFVVHEVAPDVTVRVAGQMQPLPAELDAIVEERWQAAVARVSAGGAGKLFNGRVFSADRLAPDTILGHMTEFRRIVAQMEDPDLFGVLGLRPLAVCGVLQCGDGVLVGRRPAAAVYQPGMWQLAPAGSVDAGALLDDGRIDLEAQVLAELTEELGLPRGSVSLPRPICIVEHPGSHVSDLGMALMAGLDGAAILAAHRAHGNREYDPLRLVAPEALPAFIAEAGALLVPPAPVFLRRLGLLP